MMSVKPKSCETFLQERRVGDAFLEDVVFGAEDVAVVLREAAHPLMPCSAPLGSLRWHWPNSP